MNKINLNTQIDLLEDASTLGEAFAEVSLNPSFQWAKIVVTDDQPNANKMRIPIEEFDNLITTGIHAPIKMSGIGEPKNHESAFGKAIGTITQLLKEKNKIIALAALWKRERPDEISALKEMYLKGIPPNVSWELSYAEEKIEDGGIQALYNVALDALTVVNNPAYTGRTAFVAMSEKDESNDTSDGKEEGNLGMEELEQAKQRISELETELEKLRSEKETANSELAELRTYKETAEKAKADSDRLEAIKEKFSKANIEKDESYFNEKRETLLAMSDEQLEFMIQELVAFAEMKHTQAENERQKTEIPNLLNKETGKINPKELGAALRESKKSK